jgi:hypothetical protein
MYMLQCEDEQVLPDDTRHMVLVIATTPHLGMVAPFERNTFLSSLTLRTPLFVFLFVASPWDILLNHQLAEERLSDSCS